MNRLRTPLFSAIVSLFLAVGTLVGGGLGPSLHDIFHHRSDAPESEGHCRHADHGVAFETHHSSMHSAECIVHSRPPVATRPDPATTEVVRPAHERLIDRPGNHQPSRFLDGPDSRGPPEST